MRTRSKNKQTSKARENAGDYVAVGFRFESDWLRKWCEFLDQSPNEVQENQSSPGLRSTIN